MAAFGSAWTALLAMGGVTLGCDAGSAESAGGAGVGGTANSAGADSAASGSGGDAAGASELGGADSGFAGAAPTGGTLSAGASDTGGASEAGTGGTESTGTSGAGGLAGSGGAEADVLPDAGAAAAGGGGDVALDGYELQVDPYGICPLVAVVNVHDIEPSDVQTLHVVVAGQDGAPDFERAYSAADTDFAGQLDTSDLTFAEPGHHVPVLGLYPDAGNTVRIGVELTDGDRVDLTVAIDTQLSTPEEAAWVPTIEVRVAETDSMEPGWTVAELSIEPDPPPPIVLVDWTRTIAFDERGAIRWALRPELPKGETFTLTRSLTGNVLTGSLDTIVEVTKLGRIAHSFSLSDYTLHHEILQIGSDDAVHASPGTSEYLGNLLVLASKDGASTVQDHILELAHDTGAILNVWDLATVLDRSRTTYIDPERWNPGVGDWLHANGLAYSNTDESIIVSGRHQGVAKIRRDGTLAWLLAPHAGWQQPQSQRLLTAVDADLLPYAESVQQGDEAAGDPSIPEFDWTFGQHSPVLLPNGDLLLFDNGSSRHWGSICGGFSRAVIFRIDEVAMTVRQMGQFLLARSESSCFVSNTHLLPTTGNLFVQPGSSYFDTGSSTSVVKEVTTQVADDGTVAFGATVFDAILDMSVIPRGYAAYSYRGHRWVF